MCACVTDGRALRDSRPSGRDLRDLIFFGDVISRGRDLRGRDLRDVPAGCLAAHLVFGITSDTLVRSSQRLRVHLGRPAAHPTATGWEEDLRARTAGVRLPRPARAGTLRVMV